MLPCSSRYHELDGLDEQVLVVGDGNFSFSVALCELLQGGSSVTSTCTMKRELMME